MTFGLSAVAFGGLVAAGGAVAGAAISSNGAKSAANTQAGASAAATQAQKDMFDKQVELQQPWLQAGQAGLNRLQYLMGLPPGQGMTQSAGPPVAQAQQAPQASGGYSAQSPQSAPTATPAAATGPWSSLPSINLGGGAGGAPAGQQFITVYRENGAGYPEPVQVPVGGSASNFAPQAQSTTALGMANGMASGTDPSSDPAYGSLLKTFGVSDFQSDPGYQFRQSEGDKALQRAASVQGGIGSGKFLKDAMNYNQGLASQDYGAAFDRFNVGQTNQFNRLAAISGIGQTAANQTGSAASNFGSQIGSNIIGAGNAMAAGQVGSANAMNNAIGQGTSMYQQNQLMNRLFPSSYGGGVSGGGGGINPGGYGFDGSGGAYWN